VEPCRKKLQAKCASGNLGARPGFTRIWLLRSFRALAFLAQARRWGRRLCAKGGRRRARARATLGRPVASP